MEQSIKKICLLIALTAGLTACGGSSSDGSTVSKYNGTWKGGCETSGMYSQRSFKQIWTLNGTSLTNNIQVWRSNASCQSDGILPVEVEANLEYKEEVTVANTCVGGKAQQVDISYISFKADGEIILEEDIKGLLKSQGINTLPKYGLICIGNDGNLYRGDDKDTDKDGSTATKRPTEMNTENPLTP